MTDSSERPPPGDLSEFPTCSVGGSTLWRVVRNGYADTPWWFSSLPPHDGHLPARFDLPAPRGTCYWADRWTVAAAETLLRDADRGGLLPLSIVEARTAVATIAPDVELADVTSDEAAGFRVTASLSSSPPPYDWCHEWALRLSEFAAGVWYGTRHNFPGRAAAFFGDVDGGQPTAPDRDQTVRLADVIDQIEQRLGLIIEEPPSLSEILP